MDAIVTDPPYGVDYQSTWNANGERTEKIANDKRPFIWWLYDAERILNDGGCLLCFCRWDVAEVFRLAIEWSGLKIGSQLVWDRIEHGMGDTATRPGPRHDLIWFAVKGKYKIPGKRPTSVYPVARVDTVNLKHPNQKPESLMSKLLRDYVRPGGTVVDPFMGSGTTGAAAKKLGFNFIGIELDEAHYKTAVRRLAR